MKALEQNWFVWKMTYHTKKAGTYLKVVLPNPDSVDIIGAIHEQIKKASFTLQETTDLIPEMSGLVSMAKNFQGSITFKLPFDG